MRTALITIITCWISISTQYAVHSDPIPNTDVDHARIVNADTEPGNWLTHGRTYNEQRFSPLTQIAEHNVQNLGLDWFFDTDFIGGLQATPLVIDGVMYVTGAWNIVYALNAGTGTVLWKYDPNIDRKIAIKLCCGPVNRGVAIWKNTLFLAALDGRLIALDTQNGNPLWQVQTTDAQGNYSITGAPRVIKDKVIIGNSGAEYDVRGYVSAYDTDSGQLIWRFYTVPGNPADGFENDTMAMAAKTWTGQWWKHGGGGTVWDSMAYDPDLNLLYFGVGNGVPHAASIRSPQGGDNLFLSSIVAVNPDNGEYVWHYQETPAETWDYTATQHIILADILWKGKRRNVIYHAPKNGFFFVIDRQTGELLSAEPYITVNWASHYNLETGRPVETNPKRDHTSAHLMQPTSLGGHNWHPMAYHPGNGLVYIPTMEAFNVRVPEQSYKPSKRHWNTGYTVWEQPNLPTINQALLSQIAQGILKAWNPVTQQAQWQAACDTIGVGGVLATAGDLVFSGCASGSFNAFHAQNGQLLWQQTVHNGVIAPPISYTYKNKQYIAVLAGRGGIASAWMGVQHKPHPTKNRILAFSLEANTPLPPIQQPTINTPPAQLTNTNNQKIEKGKRLYGQHCTRCHGAMGVSDGSTPDLRNLTPTWHKNFNAVVLDGLMTNAGMPHFSDVLNETDADAIHAYIIELAKADHTVRNNPDWLESVKYYCSSALGWVLGKVMY